MDAPTTMYLLNQNGHGYGYGYGNGRGNGYGNGHGYGKGHGGTDPLTPEHVICLLAARRLTCTC